MMASQLIAVCSWGALPIALQNIWTVFGAIFGVPLLVAVTLSYSVCNRIASCPQCGGGLWSLRATDKPIGMQLRDGVDSCPHCGTPISS
jgi:hypothetical protein